MAYCSIYPINLNIKKNKKILKKCKSDLQSTFNLLKKIAKNGLFS